MPTWAHEHMNPQVASSVILIRPTGFGFDPETAASNTFQQRITDPEVKRKAAEEFDGLLEALRTCGIDFTVLDPFDSAAPNGVFPNNWFSTHADGTVVLYPMLTPSRRAERDPEMEKALQREGLNTRQTLDFSGWEHQGLILEGTGSLVLDRVNKKAFACLSERTTDRAVNAWCENMGYTPITFVATEDGRIPDGGGIRGIPVYHTNVVMSIGERFAVVCLDAMPYPAERQEVEEELKKSGKEVIVIGIEQMQHFLGNMLQLQGRVRFPSPPGVGLGVRSYIFLSETAFHQLKPEQRIALQQHGQLVPVPIPTIEAVGGGSVRCMLAENFLPRA
ncbi:MAG: amidinotransferase [Flavobacteriales bacterium]|nr:amidinotransferase [Flavobacteriales bacterium]